MNTKQLTYPTIKEQQQFWINKEAQSNNATPETRDVCMNCGQWQNWTPFGYYDCFHGCAERGFIVKRPTPGASPQIPNSNASTTADPKPEELSRTESLSDWYDHGRNDENREDLRDEGRNPDGSGESLSERNH